MDTKVVKFPAGTQAKNGQVKSGPHGQLITMKPRPKVVHTVELLRDSRGIYGIGFVEGADVEDVNKARILLRPDRFVEKGCGGIPIYQMITGGYRHGMFSHTAEERLRRAIHYPMLARAGMPWPPSDEQYRKQFSAGKEVRARYRQTYHGLRRCSLRILNRLIAQALEEAAVPEAVKQARRFRFCYRWGIYEAGARSQRALQLVETFPALALAIYCGYSGASSSYAVKNLRRSRSPDELAEAAAMVERGVALKRIAGFMDIPMALRKVKPGAAREALSVTCRAELPEKLFHAYLPDSLPKMKIWLAAIEFAAMVGPDYLEWTAKHAVETAPNKSGALSFLEDTADWVRASYCAGVPPHVLRAVSGQAFADEQMGDEFITRKFAASMSLATVRELSGEWHEAVAQNMDGPNIAFPEPWHEAASVDGHEILPVTNSADLYREGKAMHHCVGAYADEIRHGRKYIYSLQKDGNRVATFELVRHYGCVKLGQLRGVCNSEVSASTKRLVRKWFRSQKPVVFPAPVERVMGGSSWGLDDDIPF